MPYDTEGPRFDGRFSDGQTAAAHNVRVAFHERGLVILRDGEEQLIWPYGALATAEPLSTHAVDALVSYRYQPGASLFVPSGGFARRLAELAPHLTTSAARRRAATPWLWAAAGVVVIGIAISAMQLSPARTIASMMPDNVRNALGERTIRAMTEGRKVCETPAGLRAVDTLSHRLTGAVPTGNRFQITVVDWGLVNAFATPGNRIVLTRGLIAKAGGPDEVAGVLAHEMGHGIELHPETGIVRSIGLAAAVELMLGGGGTVGNLGAMLLQLSYSRQAEREADERALDMLRGAGISANGIADFFRRIEGLSAGSNEGDGGGGVTGMLSTHPATADRLRRIAAAPRYPSTPALSPADWQAMKTMCGTPAGE
ncbi:MAG: M48 family metallopeptidase [Hyphomicrobiaceae bacterium]|nr:M48 family metallopeptidase [Hyphomicrobiaceae bacterium]